MPFLVSAQRSASADAPVLGPQTGLAVPGTVAWIEPALDNLAAFPAPGDSLRNYARGYAADLCGCTMDEADASWGGSTLADNEGRLELTSAGALRGIINKDANGSNRAWMNLIPVPILEYVTERLGAGDTFYIGAILRRTDTVNTVSPPAQPPNYMIKLGDTVVTNGELFMLGYLPDTENTDYQNTYLRPGNTTGITSTTGGMVEDTVIRAFTDRSILTGDWTGAEANLYGQAQWIQPSAPGGNIRGGPSWNFYGFIIENRAVSGRTRGQIETAVADYLGRAFAAGGLYAGETWTAADNVGW